MESIKLSRPLICFDLETTGVDPLKDRIVQIACIKRSPGSPEVKAESLVNPGRPIPKEASEVHGITDATVEKSNSFKQISKSLFDFFSGCDVTGYNIRQFDVPLLSAEFSRCGIKWPEKDTKIVDSFEILLRKEERDLSWALDYYKGEVLKNAHDAMADSVAALSVLEGQAEKYNCSTVEELESLARDPGALDLQGRFRLVDEEVCITFGKHRDKEIRNIPRSYLRWMLSQDFLPDTKKIVSDYLSQSRAS
ncbi:MAG: 3'-5' exonuclease [Gammaproteobacteria bacterium]|nr:3'-5' exonuclease [Gammaproteobacteria bacterium]